ncbi:hypothetical protein ACKX2L_04315 [Lachnospiraceae bacterium YH-ros2228]
MISKKQYELMKAEFGTVSSWAVWAPQIDTVKSGTGDISFFEKDDIVDVLNPNYVFVGLNASSTHVQKTGVANIRVWGNFHSTDNRRQHDYKLRYALQETPYWGGYITDIIKYHAEVDSNKVSRFLREHPEVVRENIALFNREIEILGTKPVLIALGDKVYEILTTYLRGQYTIVKVKHYSFRIGKEDYRREMLEVLKGL